MAKISVIGSGGWGTANAILLANNGHSVTLWSYLREESDALRKTRENANFLPGAKIPESIKLTSDLAECADADLIVFATPSFAVKSTAKAMSGYVKDGQLVLNISKGFDEESGMRLSEVICAEMPNVRIASMSGPSHAEEVAVGMPTTNVVACSEAETAQYIQDLYMAKNFRVYTNDDLIGLELGGSLKNIIALAAGICDGLGYGDNTKAALITRGLVEITRLGVKMGAKSETFSGLTGMGDLIVTCTSMHSRNRRAGILIGKGASADEAQRQVKMTVEGVRAARAARRLAEKYGVDMPITETVCEILDGTLSVADAAEILMGRAKKHESEKGWLEEGRE